MRISGLVVVVWLLIGVFAAYQRGYLTGAEDVDCSGIADTALTVVAGPLNYVGVNPTVDCADVPQPSE